ncbi:TonB-dependent receptor [Zoogloea dura]|jgi:iron complex outermembrane receptor protein|uniref:TonB-dependent siderophore receptor n=1 Tax=Zoogloea dura TaxID=2728840 RepID=A0A848G728_9RHOO|nr:TonB-dependent siderophore receptor [Zoogloea dura]NML26213.1 TonB-dependent siderophore receptor [Zoogloea dura]
MLRMTPVALALSVALLPQSANAQVAAAEGSAGEATLTAVKVSAGTDSPTELPSPYAGGQVAKGARLGALGNQNVMDTPFNITSYTAELIENQHARSIADVVANDPSVRFTTSGGHMYENFRIRGFDVNQNDVSIDGMFGLVPSGHVPLEFVERVEVFKGPSALFGGMAPSGAVGGTINLSPKRAGDAPLTRVSVGVQSGSQLSTSVDVGRRFGERKAWGLRVNAAYSDGDTTLDGQSKKREFVSAALDYRGNALKASLDTYYSKESFKGGTPAMFWFATTAIPKAPDPSINPFPAAYGELESKALIARADYEFRRGLAAFAGVGLMHHDFAGFINGTHIRSINAAGISKTSFTSGQRGYNENLASEAGLRASFDTAGVGHELVLHASGLSQESGAGSSISSPAFTTSIYSPTFQAMPSLPATTPKTSETDLSSLALMDTLSFLEDRLRLTIGLRNQQIKTTNYNAAGAVTARYDKSAVTPAVTIVAKPWGPAVSLYANYVEGLSKGDTVTTPTTATNYLHVFAPYKTEQKEAGVKWNAGSFAHTASLFEITRPMMVATGSSAAPTLSDDGEKRIRGLEWNTFGELARGLRLLGGATYTQGVQTKTAYGLNDGKVAVGAPRWQGNLGSEWDVPGLPGLTLSGRLIATTNQYLDAANTIRIPGWGQVDAGARYATMMDGRRLVLRLNVINLFDRHYYAGSFSDTTPIATLGLARSVSASATMDF